MYESAGEEPKLQAGQRQYNKLLKDLDTKQSWQYIPRHDHGHAGRHITCRLTAYIEHQPASLRCLEIQNSN